MYTTDLDLSKKVMFHIFFTLREGLYFLWGIYYQKNDIKMVKISNS